MVPLVSGEWAQVTPLASGERSRSARADAAVLGTQALSDVSRWCDAATFGRLALPQLHRRWVWRAAQVVAVTERAAWLQRFVDLHRSDALGM